MGTPYLNFCKAWGVDYGEALSFVDAYKKKFDKDAMSVWEKRAMHRLQHTETAKALIAIYENLKDGGDGNIILSVIQDHFRSDQPYKFRFPLGSDLAFLVEDKAHYMTEIRAQYDMKEKEPIFLCRIVLCRMGNTNFIFRLKPETIRYGYRVHDGAGNYRVIGDTALFFPDYEDQMEAAAFRQVVRRHFPED